MNVSDAKSTGFKDNIKTSFSNMRQGVAHSAKESDFKKKKNPGLKPGICKFLRL